MKFHLFLTNIQRKKFSGLSTQVCNPTQSDIPLFGHHFFQKALKFENNISWKAWKRKSFRSISDPLIPKKNFIFLLEKTFFFRWPGLRPSALRATEQTNFFQQKKNFCFGSTGQKLIQSFFLFQLFKIFIITNFYQKKHFPQNLRTKSD